MSTLWNMPSEKTFFTKSLAGFATPEQLFYKTRDNKFLAYWPKNYRGTKSTLQSRNALIGSYTEKWTADLFSEIAKAMGGHAVQDVISEEIGLTNRSPADIAICKTAGVIQKPQDILLLIEVKMSVVWNWEFIPKKEKNGDVVCIGDYKTHTGNPSLLRSDTMLKAIGKSINIRVSSLAASRIPIVIIGNTPIAKSYSGKVDHLRRTGVIQGFWSVNPKPLDSDGENIKATRYEGFYRLDDYQELSQKALALLKEEREHFSSMQTRKRLGEIIEVANRESTYEAKARKFLELIHQ